jgi:hypothetical protein
VLTAAAKRELEALQAESQKEWLAWVEEERAKRHDQTWQPVDWNHGSECPIECYDAECRDLTAPPMERGSPVWLRWYEWTYEHPLSLSGPPSTDDQEAWNLHLYEQEREAGEFTVLTNVKPESVDWLWRDRLPIGKITVLDGDPGLGKSMMMDDLAARFSTGADMPDGQPCGISGGCGVVICQQEDGLGDTIVPRLMAAGADLSRIVHINKAIRMPDDLDVVTRACRRVRAHVVMIDPLTAHLGDAKTRINDDKDVRTALAPLKRWLEENGIALLACRHLNKAGGKDSGPALYRGLGSIGIVASARMSWIVGKDPEDPDNWRILAPGKNNLARQPDARKYRIDTAYVGTIETARIVWGGASQVQADQLVQTKKEDPTKVEEAAEFLREFLADGPKPAKMVEEEGARRGHSERTLRRARKLVGMPKPTRNGFDNWLWSLGEE